MFGPKGDQGETGLPGEEGGIGPPGLPGPPVISSPICFLNQIYLPIPLIIFAGSFNGGRIFRQWRRCKFGFLIIPTNIVVFLKFHISF